MRFRWNAGVKNSSVRSARTARGTRGSRRRAPRSLPRPQASSSLITRPRRAAPSSAGQRSRIHRSSSGSRSYERPLILHEVARARIHRQPRLGGEVAVVPLDQLVHLARSSSAAPSPARRARTLGVVRLRGELEPRARRARPRAARARSRSRAGGASTRSARRARGSPSPRPAGSCAAAARAAALHRARRRAPPRAAAARRGRAPSPAGSRPGS